MIWGVKHTDRDTGYKWFAWHPVHLTDGRWAWLHQIKKKRLIPGWYEYSELNNAPVSPPKPPATNTANT